MKHFVISLLGILISYSASAEQVSVRCRGSAPDMDMLFKYEIQGDSATSVYRTRLQVMVGYNNLQDFGWKEVVTTNGKISVDSPFPQYLAVIKQVGRRFDLLMLDPKSGVPTQAVPYDNFTCVPR
ncbi:hypothetical protein [Bdellovibrio sp. NC01]|uniref:hypothetical protein n=1 Tax=Bdellovibrio sp. NC01 TaxID=2220073 RepID=UPI00115A23E4|nr:hypothetical protein [Bdellovibrio sp. NC01]QDK36386.1 hypothetical protein DOE51_01605 [Bdellovibrio sp. NC01]